MINSITPNYSSTQTAYSQIGRQPVGHETSDLKQSSFKALEQGAESARGQGRRETDERTKVTLSTGRGDADGRRIKARDQSDDQSGSKNDQRNQERKKISALEAVDREIRVRQQVRAVVEPGATPTYQFVKGPDGLSYAVDGALKARVALENATESSHVKSAKEPETRVAEKTAKSDQEQAVTSNTDSEEKDKAVKTLVDTKPAVTDDKALRRSLANAEALNRIAKNSININRRLIDIGAIDGFKVVGTFLNKKV